jgi:dTDP-3-amino-3,4,6-trideoxy-alpha-D-glucose transaminase
VRVPFLDLARQTPENKQGIDAAIARVLASGQYVLTEEVDRFEEEYAESVGVAHAIGVASGTDAITIALLAAGVQPGDEVITVPNTCIPTIVGIERSGARPVLADVDPQTYTLDPDEVERSLTPRTRAIVPVHLYGQTADLGKLTALAQERHLLLIEDCAQAHGATYQGRQAGSIGLAAAFSFYPTKNLGALGDGGAVTTNDADIAAKARLLRNYGERERFEHVLRGLNSRLDALQAAILAAKLPRLGDANNRRRALARIYEEALAGTPLVTPFVDADRVHTYHLYVVQTDDRAQFRASLTKEGIDTAVHYPTPVHRQPAYRELDRPGGFPIAESLCERIVSLPLSDLHTDEEIAHTARASRVVAQSIHA